MKYKFVLVSLILPFAVCQCWSNKQLDKCEIYNNNSARCIYEFQIRDDVSYLDSALFYIDEIFGKCDKYNALLAVRKIGIYSDKHDIYSAIEFINTLDDQLFYLPYYKNLLLNRFKAMAAQEREDTLNKNIFLRNIVSDVTKFMSLHKEELDTLMQSKRILQSKYSFAPIHLYYYKAQINGVEEVKIEIDSLQRMIGGNEEYFEMMKGYLDEDFMYFAGF